MNEYFLNLKFFGANVKVELDLSNYATKEDLKMQQVLIHWILLKKNDFTNLKFDIDELDIGKLETTPNDLSKLSDVVKKEIVKMTEYDGLVKTVINIKNTGTGDLV